jgi:hypothetical protein
LEISIFRIWIYVIEPTAERKKERLILDVYLSAAERNRFVVVIEKFLNSLIKDKIMEKQTYTHFHQIWW